MDKMFGPDGLIAQAHPEYEYRPGQIQMAEAVMRAFEDRHHLIVEAGTGTGQTPADLVPAGGGGFWGGARGGLSAGAKKLQKEVVGKGQPLPQRRAPQKISAPLL